MFSLSFLCCLCSATSLITLRAATAFAPGPFSADGRYFVFNAGVDDLVPNDHNRQWDVFRHDRQNDTFELVSINQSHTGGGDLGSFAPAISADGSVVAFESGATDLAALDRNGHTDVFVRDLTTGVTTLISLNRSGSGSGNGFSFGPKLSADGRVVIFQSSATDLVAMPDVNGDLGDVFAHDRVTGVTTLVSANRAGTDSGNRSSFGGVPSADGRVVVFSSSASDLVSNDGNGAVVDVFARDLAAGVTALVNINQTGTGSGNAGATDPSVSADGTIVAFASSSTDLVPNDNNGTSDIFVRDLTTGVTRLVSVNLNAGGSGNGISVGPDLSADGKRVAFSSRASNLVANDGNDATDVFVRDLTTGSTRLVSRSFAGMGSANGLSSAGILSADGTVAAFSSAADDLTVEPVDGLPNQFVAVLATGEIHLTSVNQSGTGSGSDLVDAIFHVPALSANGAVLAFGSTATDLVARNVDGVGPVFLFDVDQSPPASGDFLETGGLVVMEAEHFHTSSTASGHAWEARTDRAGFIGESAMRALPNNGANLTANVVATSPALSYLVEFTTSGTYNFWVRGFGTNGSDDSVHIGVDGQVLQSLPYSQTGAWMWRAKQVVISSPGLHEINVWMREDGAYVDRVLLAANLSFTPTGSGPVESVRTEVNSAPQIIEFNPPGEDWPPEQMATVAVGESLRLSVTAEELIDDRGLYTCVWVSDLRPIVTQIVAGGGDRVRSTIDYTPTADDIGTRTITLTIADTGGLSDSHTFTVIVTGPQQPPNVALIAPADGSVFSAGTPITVSAEASDPDGNAIEEVRLLANGVLLKRFIESELEFQPYSFNWTPEAGMYELTATALDDTGRRSTSAPVLVTIMGGFAESGGLVVMEAEHYDSAASGSGREWLARTDRAGFVGDAAMQALPNTGANISANITTACPVLNYNVLFNTTGTYNFWIRGFGANGSDDSVHVGVDGQVLQTLPYSRTGAWMWRAKQVVISTPGLHAVNVWMREDGAYVDRVLLSANLSFVPTGDGPPESGRSGPLVGEPLPDDPTNLTVWPNQTSRANSDQWLADNHDNLRQMNPRVLVVNLSNKHAREALEAKLTSIIVSLAEGSRYHGYEDPTATAFLNYQVFKFVDLRDEGTTTGNSSKLPLKSNGHTDHQQFYGEQFAQYYGVRAPENPAHFLQLGELIDRGYVHELWYFAEHLPGFNPHEVIELKPRYDEQFQRIGDEHVHAGNGLDPDQPWTGRAVRIGFINASLGIGFFVHGLGHGVEGNSISQAIPYFTRYFTEFAGFDLKARFQLPWFSLYCHRNDPPDQPFIEYPDPSTAIVTDGGRADPTFDCGALVAPVTISNYVAFGGNVHFPPNARFDYDYNTNTVPVLSTIEDWRIGSGPGGTDLASPWTREVYVRYINSETGSDGAWQIYWRQNFPGLDNLQADANGAPMKNWWPFLFY